MALEIQDIRGEKSYLHLKSLQFDHGKAQAILQSNELESNFIIDYPLPVIKTDEKYSESKIFLFKNKFGTKEDQFYKIQIEGDRKGIIFPLKNYSDSTTLPKHDGSNSSNFIYRFLLIAFYHLLDCKGFPSRILNHEKITEANLKIEDFYDNETIVFLYHDSTNNLAGANLNPVYPSLLKNGFVPILIKSDFEEVEVVDLVYDKHPLYGKPFLDNLNLKKISPKLINEKYILQFFSTIIKLKLSSIARFILLYQVIELLIDKIALEYYQNNKPFNSAMTILMISADKSSSYRDTYDYLSEIQTKISSATEKIKTEISRIRILVSEKSKLDISNFKTFAIASDLLIASEKCKNLPDYIYALRNKIIHDYHNLSIQHVDIDDLLSDINIEFERVICSLLISYE